MALIEPSPLEKVLAWAKAGLASLLTLRPKAIRIPLGDTSRDVVWRQDGPDPGAGLGPDQWLEIVRRSDGHYSFAEWKRQTLSDAKLGQWEAQFPLYESGLYGSESEAMQGLADHRLSLAEGRDDR